MSYTCFQLDILNFFSACLDIPKLIDNSPTFNNNDNYGPTNVFTDECDFSEGGYTNFWMPESGTTAHFTLDFECDRQFLMFKIRNAEQAQWPLR